MGSRYLDIADSGLAPGEIPDGMAGIHDPERFKEYRGKLLELIVDETTPLTDEQMGKASGIIFEYLDSIPHHKRRTNVWRLGQKIPSPFLPLIEYIINICP